jgi:PAS domain S-box-containing protein
MVSETASQLLGYAPKELMSKQYIDFVVENDRAATEVIAREIMAGRPISDFTNHYSRKDGTVVPITWSAKWIEEDKMMYCLARNATERIKTSKQLAQNQTRLIYAQKIARLGNWDWDLKNNEWSCSDEIYNLLGIPKNETDDMQQLLLAAIHPADRALLHKAREEALTLGKPIDIEHRIIRADHFVCYVHTKGEVLLDENGKPIWFSGTMQDITERKATEIELKKLNENLKRKAKELEAINVELERFAYVASHDLQEPLRMVSSFLALLQKRIANDLDDTSNKYIHFVVDGAERMKKLIQDLLQYSRLDSKNTKYEPVCLNDVAANVLSVFQVTIEERNAVIDVDDLPTVPGNKTHLVQLFQNLIGNALKFGTADQPFVQIGCKEEKDEWLISVKDNGIGIEAKYFDKIFVIFQRLHNKDEYSGTGIGLAICKKIVERHGGRIWVESQPGQGSTFYFTLKKPAHV